MKELACISVSKGRTTDVFVCFNEFCLGCAGSSLLHRLSPVVTSRGSSLVVVHSLLIAAASLVVEHGL